jgi:hypothetical protein
MGRDGRQYVVLMATGGGSYLGGGSSNSLVAFALPDIHLKPLPGTVSRAVAAAAATSRGQPQVGSFAPAALPAGEATKLAEKTCGTGCHSVEVVTSQRLSPQEWSALVENMVNRGAQATDTQAKAIADYLGKTLSR